MSTDPVIRAAEAETVDSPQHLIRLLADGINTAGAFSIIQVELRAGRDGAAPHFHSGFSELLYVIDGDVEVLCDDRISMAHAGISWLSRLARPTHSARWRPARPACWR